MKAGSMEGLIGASLNMKLSSTPMQIYKEAELKGDTETMVRAMGYVTDFQDKAHEYSNKAQEELVKEMKEERNKQELKRNQAIEKRKEEMKEYKEKLQGSNKSDIQKADSIEISEDGKVVLKNNVHTEEAAPSLENTDVKMYTSGGKPVSIETASVSVDTKIGEQ